MYLANKYTVWYYNLINRAQTRALDQNTYSEKHHIIPKSLGGSNNKENIVRLTAREHFVCHMLLVKMTTNKDQRKMRLAIHKMISKSSNQERHVPNSQQYQWIRKQCSLAVTGSNNPNYGNNHKWSDDQKLKVTGPNHQNYGKKWTEEYRRKRELEGHYWTGKKRPYAPRKYDIVGSKNPNARSVSTPNGIFTTVKEASACHNIGPNALRSRIKKYPNEYYFL